MPLYNVYSTPDLKAAADEALPWILDGMGYRQNYVFEFVRLSLGYLAVAAAGFTYWIEKKKGFNAAFSFITAGVVLYGMFNGLFYLWYYFKEQRAVYIGSKDNQTVYIRTTAPKSVNEYTLYVTSGKLVSKASTPFNEIIDFNGQVSREKLREFVAQALAKKTQ